MSSEISRAEEAEASIALQLSSEVSSILENTDLTAIDSFAEVVADLSSEIANREGAVSAEESARISIDEAIKAGVNAALIEIKDIILKGARDASFKRLTTLEGDGVETTFNVPMYGNGAIYLNGLLQHYDVDYSTNPTVDGKGNPELVIIFDEAPELDSLITIYGLGSEVNDDNWFGNITPLV